MTPVGERLRHEREVRNTSLEQLAEATGIGLIYLRAMEQNDYEALPGRAFGKLYVRAYAEVLEFDPQPLIDQYDREQQLRIGTPADTPRPEPAGARPVAAAIARWRESKAPPREATSDPPAPREEPIVEAAVEAAVEAPVEASVEASVACPAAGEPEPPPPVPKANRRVAVFALALVAIVAVVSAGLYVARRESGSPESSGPREPAPPVEIASEPVVSPAPTPPPSLPPTVRSAPQPRPSAPGSLSVPEFGLGRRIVGSRVEGEGTEFGEGEVACFQTRVVGGHAGDAVRHVWIRDGRAQQAITLRVGGPDWRTHSTKTLFGLGSWTVEARDRDGRVLATALFSVGMIPPRVGGHR